jgi:hypothetical protein
MLDNLFLNPLAPHPKASESTMVRPEYSREYIGPGGMIAAPPGGWVAIHPTPTPTPDISYGADVEVIPEQHGVALRELEASGASFDFLSFLAADDGGREANAQWLSTESYRQDMPMLG